MSKIEWTDVTWNPVTGCTKVSAGCKNCYAERMSKRLAGRHGYPAEKPFGVTLHKERLNEPLHWRNPRRVFVCSMGDLFHEDVPQHFICSVFKNMQGCPQHTFMVLTKRPDRAKWWLRDAGSIYGFKNPPLPNVWLGVSAEDQATADKRIPILLDTPAAVRFVSCEPLLGPMDLRKLGYWWNIHARHNLNALRGYEPTNLPPLDWVIVGGESGPGARPMHPDWARSIRDQCKVAGVAFFFKQWGEWIPFNQASTEQIRDNVDRSGEVGINHPVYRVGKKAAGRELDGVIHNSWPA